MVHKKTFPKISSFKSTWNGNYAYRFLSEFCNTEVYSFFFLSMQKYINYVYVYKLCNIHNFCGAIHNGNKKQFMDCYISPKTQMLKNGPRRDKKD